MWKWLVLVSSVAAAEPIGVTVGGGWRYPGGVTNMRDTPPGAGQGELADGRQVGGLDASVFARLSSQIAVGVHTTTSTTLGVHAAYGDSLGNPIFSTLLLRPVTIAVAARYLWRPFWVSPWIGREFLHARYTIAIHAAGNAKTVHRDEWDDNGPVIGVAAGVDLASQGSLALSIFAEIQTVFDGGRDDLAYTPYIDSAFTFGFGARL